MAKALLSIEGVSRRFGGLLAVNHVSLAAPTGRITALIGPNGAGKTTLFALISGFLAPTEGSIHYGGEPITTLPAHERARRGIARTFQIVQPFSGLSVRDNIVVGAHLHHPTRAAALDLADAIGRELGLGAMLDRPADTLTVAGRKRLELARALATKPKLLLLDEVLAGLNPTEVEHMIGVVRRIRERGVTILIIEHLMQAIMNLSDRIVVLNFGEKLAEGVPAEVARHPQVIEAYLGDPKLAAELQGGG